MKVSIIITTYKRANMLKRAIDSVLEQTYKNIEIIVIDDNDSDSIYRKETEEIMNQYKNNIQVKYIKHEKNMNGAAARNTGIKNSVGEYITFLDDDDFYYKNKVEEQIKYLETNKDKEMVYCGWKRMGKNVIKKYEGNLSYELLSGKIVIYTNSIMVRRDSVISCGGWDEEYKRNQEAAFLLRLFRKNYKIGYINKVLFEFDISDRGNALKGKENEKQFSMLLEKNNDIIKKMDNRKRKEIYCGRYRCVLLDYIKNKQYIEAIKKYTKSIKEFPIYFNFVMMKYIKEKILGRN